MWKSLDWRTALNKSLSKKKQISAKNTENVIHCFLSAGVVCCRPGPCCQHSWYLGFCGAQQLSPAPVVLGAHHPTDLLGVGSWTFIQPPGSESTIKAMSWQFLCFSDGADVSLMVLNPYIHILWTHKTPMGLHLIYCGLDRTDQPKHVFRNILGFIFKISCSSGTFLSF